MTVERPRSSLASRAPRTEALIDRADRDAIEHEALERARWALLDGDSARAAVYLDFARYMHRFGDGDPERP